MLVVPAGDIDGSSDFSGCKPVSWANDNGAAMSRSYPQKQWSLQTMWNMEKIDTSLDCFFLNVLSVMLHPCPIGHTRSSQVCIKVTHHCQDIARKTDRQVSHELLGCCVSEVGMLVRNSASLPSRFSWVVLGYIWITYIYIQFNIYVNII